jgi:hypothetical protein
MGVASAAISTLVIPFLATAPRGTSVDGNSQSVEARVIVDMKYCMRVTQHQHYFPQGRMFAHVPDLPHQRTLRNGLDARP